METLYMKYYNNTDAKRAFMWKDWQGRMFLRNNGFKQQTMKEELCTVPMGIATLKSYNMIYVLEEVIQLTIPAGIPQYLYQRALEVVDEF